VGITFVILSIVVLACAVLIYLAAIRWLRQRMGKVAAVICAFLFTIFGLCGAVFVLALAIPQLLVSRKGSNQISALQAIRAIGMAENEYISVYPRNGFACSLTALGGEPGTPPNAKAAHLLDAQLAATGNKYGYSFAITNCTKVTVNNQDMITGYKVTALPAAVGKTGDRGYCMDEKNVLAFDPTGGNNCTESIK
jgi:type IV pilus assembly protein PilA